MRPFRDHGSVSRKFFAQEFIQRAMLSSPTTKNACWTPGWKSKAASFKPRNFVPLRGGCGDVCAFTRPYFICCDFRTTVIHGRGRLEIIRTGVRTAAAISSQHPLSAQRKRRNPIRSDISAFFYFSCFWNTALFCTLLAGTAMYSEWYSVRQPRTWVVFSVLSDPSCKSHFYYCKCWAYYSPISGFKK